MFGMREKHNNDGSDPDQGQQGGIGDNIGELRQKGEDLLSAADDAIDKGLSRESHRFNTSVRQASGQ